MRNRKNKLYKLPSICNCCHKEFTNQIKKAVANGSGYLAVLYCEHRKVLAVAEIKNSNTCVSLHDSLTAQQVPLFVDDIRRDFVSKIAGVPGSI